MSINFTLDKILHRFISLCPSKPTSPCGAWCIQHFQIKVPSFKTDILTFSIHDKSTFLYLHSINGLSRKFIVMVLKQQGGVGSNPTLFKCLCARLWITEIIQWRVRTSGLPWDLWKVFTLIQNFISNTTTSFIFLCCTEVKKKKKKLFSMHQKLI